MKEWKASIWGTLKKGSAVGQSLDTVVYIGMLEEMVGYWPESTCFLAGWWVFEDNVDSWGGQAWLC
jgi:hypothetical protein